MVQICFVLGSTSVHKLQALREVLGTLNISAQVIGYPADSRQQEQPEGVVEGFDGATCRALDALRPYIQCPSGPVTYFVGIESFVTLVPEGLTSVCLDMAAIVIYDKDRNLVATATSPGFVFPMDAYTAAKEAGLENHTVGSKVAEMLGGDGTDPHSLLSSGRITRMQTLMAGLSVAINQLPIF